HCRRHQTSISWPQPSRLHTRTRTVSPLTSLTLIPTRVGCLQVGQTIITFDTSSGIGFDTIPPGIIVAPPMRVVSRIGRGFVWRLPMLRFSTITCRSRGRAWRTRPCLPRSLPASTWTRSPFLIRMVVAISEHLGGEADDLHEVLLTQLAGDGPEDARSTRVQLVVDDDGGVLVEADQRAVTSAIGLLRPDDDRSHDLALLDRALRRCGLHCSDDLVADASVSAARAAHDPDAEKLA